MGPTRTILLSLLLAFPSFTYSQSSQSVAPQVTSDPAAVKILQQSLAAMGGSASVSLISDLTEVGSFAGQSASGATISTIRTYVKGTNQVRMETDTPDGLSVLIYANGQGYFSRPDASGFLRTHSVVGRGLEYFPALRVNQILASPGLATTQGQLTEFNGQPVYEIKIAGPTNSDPTINAFLTSSSRIEILISTQTFLPVRLRYFNHPDSDSRVDWPTDIIYGNYQAIQGVLMPFSMTQIFRGQTLGTFTINSVSFNSGLSDEIFALVQP